MPNGRPVVKQLYSSEPEISWFDTANTGGTVTRQRSARASSSFGNDRPDFSMEIGPLRKVTGKRLTHTLYNIRAGTPGRTPLIDHSGHERSHTLASHAKTLDTVRSRR